MKCNRDGTKRRGGGAQGRHGTLWTWGAGLGAAGASLPTSLAGRGLFPVPLGSLGSREPQNRSVHGFLPEFGGSWGEGEYEVTTDENVSISNTSPAVF